jgi:hypothetical protein
MVISGWNKIPSGDRRMPTIAIPLSVLGLVPFIYFAFGAVGQIPGTAERMYVSLIDYAAVILSFSGGVHWGLAIVPNAVRPGVRIGAGVLPLVVAWIGVVVAQMVAPSVALVVLLVGYLATMLAEQPAAQRGLLPSNYVWMRWGFTGIAMALMIMVLILRGVGQTIVF